jgi:hypothetical protein
MIMGWLTFLFSGPQAPAAAFDSDRAGQSGPDLLLRASGVNRGGCCGKSEPSKVAFSSIFPSGSPCPKGVGTKPIPSSLKGRAARVAAQRPVLRSKL